MKSFRCVFDIDWRNNVVLSNEPMTTEESNSNFSLPGLVKIRIFLDLSRPKLAKAVGCHPNSIVNIENTARAARLELASKLAKVLCCRLDDFVHIPTQKRLKEIKRDYHLQQAEEAGAA